MKLSIRWIFDHIQGKWSNVDIPQLITLFNEKTAEIEHVERVQLKVDAFSSVLVQESDGDMVTAHSKEWDTVVTLNPRANVQVGLCYLIKKEKEEYQWATMADFGSDKEGLFPAVHDTSTIMTGEWKQQCELDDYVIHVDNKSITNRPDLWGHRGFAREIAALLDLPFKDISDFIIEKPIATSDSTQAKQVAVLPSETNACKRFAGLYFDMVLNRSSSLWMAHRLARIDARPIDLLVDSTNYVMFDTSQPLHAFDADAIKTKQIVPRMGSTGDTLELLDGQKIELTDQDVVISDGERPIALAGIMGGKKTGVNRDTTSILLESANFDATTIRRSSVRFKTRSEASARFEKTLDPNQNIIGIQRFLKILNDENSAYKDASAIVSHGPLFEPIVLELSHTWVESCIGVHIDESFVQKTLTAVGFHVAYKDGNYTITVPTFRATKDVTIKQDVVEEIVRFYGYSKVTPTLPEKPTTAHSLESVYRRRSIRKLCAYGMQARELYTYAFFDESFLHELSWQPIAAVEVKNPVSENYRRLVTTLIPGLLKAVAVNNQEERLRFFEFARVWSQIGEIKETNSLAGLFFDKKEVDFYDAKAELSRLFSLLKMSVKWQKVDEPNYPWYMPYQTAQLVVDGVVIGTAGKLQKQYISSVIEGDAFAFELDGNALLAYVPEESYYHAPSRYPSVDRDISMLVPLTITVDEVTQAIASVGSTINDIQLVDRFGKKEWSSMRSMTFRFTLQAYDHTLTKEEADALCERVVSAVQAIGAQIR